MSYWPFQIIDSSYELYHPPASPSAFDDEFDDNSLDPKWDLEGSLSASAPVVPVAFSSSDQRQDYGVRRRSWISMQSGTGGSQSRGISQLIDAGGLPTGVYWWRWGPMFRGVTSGVNNNGNCTAQLGASSGGSMDFGEGIRFELERDNNAVNLQCTVFEGGGNVGPNDNTGDFDIAMIPWEYCAFRVTASNVAQVWGARPVGGWQYLNTYTYTGGATLDRISFSIFNVSTTNPGNLMFMLDFFRYKSGLDLP